MRSASCRPAHPAPVALALIALVLTGCVDGPGSRHEVRNIDAGGGEAFHSRIRLLPTMAYVECLASDSGRCHYAIFGGSCGSLAAALDTDLIDCAPDSGPRVRFSLAVGERRQVDGLPLDYRHCASARSVPAGASCLRTSGPASSSM
ncbi:hypothetical protein [Marilutibacter chinensis]|uniref:Lipoprotein n=1 Tax=Marilutibacter chinensis TaxID=2912247 RepID=A0ABS9HZM2_9GAMM|nr:hypothetical protein [Lysobacter chinensis]MCF7223640.1 hypothetical protein [Lysobacter chinensis]